MANLNVNGTIYSNSTISTSGGSCSVAEKGNDYIRYDNGLQICWGKIPAQSTSGMKTINFTPQFKEGTVPCVLKTYESTSTATNASFRNFAVDSVSNTGFQTFMSDTGTVKHTGAFWFAIGEW